MKKLRRFVLENSWKHVANSIKDDTDEESNSEEDEKEQNELEEKETELENKTSDYMTNAMKAMRSNQESVEEDQFFKLDEMENFLDAEDAKGRLISKCLYGVIVWTKIASKIL